MARINIEDSLYKDNRFTDLCIAFGCKYKALGSLTALWALGQQYYKREQSPIPRDKWNEQRLPKELLDIGWAVEREDGIHVDGAAKQFKWLVDNQENASAGGKESAKRPRDEKGRLLPKQTPSEVQAAAGLSQANPSESSAPTPTPSLSPTLIHSTNSGISFSDENDSESAAKPRRESRRGKKTQGLIARYCELWREKYGGNPPILGKDAGIAGRIAKDISEEKINLYLEAFFQMPDPWLTKVKHPLSQLELKINEVAVFADCGKFTTRTEVNQQDKGAAQFSQLDRIRRGEL